MARVEPSIAILSLVIAGGCAIHDDEVGLAVREGKSLNGKSLNGKSLNGKSLNGSPLGTSIVWTSLAGIKLDGETRLDEAWLDGTELVGRIGSTIIRGTGLRQAELEALSDTGSPLRLRTREVTRPAAAGEPWRYWVEYRDTDGGWYPICLVGQEAQPAIAITGWWNPQEGVPGGGGKVEDATRVTFACPQVGAIGKCIDLGYRPWASAAGVPLGGHHASCVRALRADYCGDGTSYTVDGTVINIYDALGVQADTEAWQFEAEWDRAGARCFSASNRSLEHVPCFIDRTSLTCGDPAGFGAGTLVMTEMQ